HHTRNFSRPVVDSPDRGHLEERLSRLETWMQKVERSRGRPSVLLDTAPKGKGSSEGEAGASNEDIANKRRSMLHVDAAVVDRESSIMHPKDEPSMVDLSPSTGRGSSPKTPTLPSMGSAYSFNHAQAANNSFDSQSFQSYSTSKLPS